MIVLICIGHPGKRTAAPISSNICLFRSCEQRLQVSFGILNNMNKTKLLMQNYQCFMLQNISFKVSVNKSDKSYPILVYLM